MTQTHPVRSRAAGSLLLLAGIAIIMGVITAEALYPGYSTSSNMISDLGGTEPPHSVIRQPSASIFNATMMGAGVLTMGSALLVVSNAGRKATGLALLFTGIGALGVGVFPGDTGTVHAVFAELAFLAGGVSAVLASRMARPPFRYFSAILGAAALLNLVLYLILGSAYPVAELGLGGLERWVAYPIVLWMVGFGGYLSAA